MSFGKLKDWLTRKNAPTDTVQGDTSQAIQSSFHSVEQRTTEDEKENKESIRIDENYIAGLETQKENLSDIHQKLLNNILNIMQTNEHKNLTNNDIKIQDGKLYLCGTMFYGELLPEAQRKKSYLSNSQNILNDGHQEAFRSLVAFTTKLFGEKFIGYTNLDNGKFQGKKEEAKQYFLDISKNNKNFFTNMTSVMLGIEYGKLNNPKIGGNSSDIDFSIPICVDNNDNIFYYESESKGRSGIGTNSYEMRSNIYQYDFIS